MKPLCLFFVLLNSTDTEVQFVVLPALETNYWKQILHVINIYGLSSCYENIIPESAAVSQVMYFENMNDGYNLMTTSEELFLNQTLSYLNCGCFHSFVVRAILAFCKSIPFSPLPPGLYRHGGSLLTLLPSSFFHPLHFGSEIVQLGGVLQPRSLFQEGSFRITLEQIS